MKVDKVVVLDLDETLVFTTSTPLGDSSLGASALPAPDYSTGGISGFIRPGAVQLLHFCFGHFKYVGIWTAATEPYAHVIVNALFGRVGLSPHFLLTDKDCEGRQLEGPLGLFYTTKPLRKLWTHPDYRWLGATPTNTLVVDDRPETAVENADNLIPMPKFRVGRPIDLYDHWLYLLVCYLRELLFVADTRAVDKQQWTQHVSACLQRSTADPAAASKSRAGAPLFLYVGYNHH